MEQVASHYHVCVCSKAVALWAAAAQFLHAVIFGDDYLHITCVDAKPAGDLCKYFTPFAMHNICMMAGDAQYID
jgi:hypothetical protein